MSLPTNQLLILDSDTQWYSILHMLETALVFKNAFPMYAMSDTSCYTFPSEEEWLRARDVCNFLAPFDKVTNIFSGCEYTTANLFFPKICKISRILDSLGQDLRDLMKLVVQRMEENFDKYWKECNMFIAIACVLDPQNKMLFIRYLFGLSYGEEEGEERLALISMEMHTVYDDYVAKERKDNIAQVCMVEKWTYTYSSRAEFEEWLDTEIEIMPTRKELVIYLDEKVLLGTGQDFDVLCWWRSNALTFPILSKMARDFLSNPVTTIPSEPAFNAARRVICDDQCSSYDDTMEGILCATNWLQAAIERC